MSSIFPKELAEVAARVANLLKERKETVSVCETAAGGLISAALLAQPGASKIFLGGLTAYQLDFRKQFVGWTDEDSANYKGPTTDIVSKLASNTRSRLKSTYAVSESGTAGPTGGNTPNRTPGYVALAVAGPGGVKGHELNTGTGEREANMLRFAVEALGFLEGEIKERAKV